MQAKFYICRHCGNIVHKVRDAGVPVSCCGQAMEELIPGAVDAAAEKHVPFVTREEGAVNVNVGSADHPMLPEHFIEWVCLQTEKGLQIETLAPGEAPNVGFTVGEGDRAEAVYAFCNLHGLWKTDL